MLSVRPGGNAVIADYVRYSAVANQSYGAVADGEIADRRLLLRATPGAPNDAASGRPELGIENVAGSGLRITWDSVLGRHYFLEASEDLKTMLWQTVFESDGNGGVLSYSESDLSGRRVRFYRVRSQ